MVTTNEAVAQVLTDYYRAFSTLDAQAVLPYFYEPAVIIGPSGVFPMPTAAVLGAMFAPVMEDLRARGYGRSELRLQNVKALSATGALASGVAVRYKTDGQELERVGVTYLLHNGGNGWKIAVLVVHDAE